MPQRRMHDRYRPLGSAFVIFESPRPHILGKSRIIKLGPITDISPEGLCVEYQHHKDYQKDFQELSILVPGQGLVVVRIPFQNIFETIVSTAFKQPPIMRRNMRFGDLDADHSRQVKDFIGTFTRGVVSDRRSGYERRNITKSDEQSAAASDQKTIDTRRSGKDRRSDTNTPV